MGWSVLFNVGSNRRQRRAAAPILEKGLVVDNHRLQSPHSRLDGTGLTFNLKSRITRRKPAAAQKNPTRRSRIWARIHQFTKKLYNALITSFARVAPITLLLIQWKTLLRILFFDIESRHQPRVRIELVVIYPRQMVGGSRLAGGGGDQYTEAPPTLSVWLDSIYNWKSN